MTETNTAGDYKELINYQIDEAYSLMEKGKLQSGLRSFDLVRKMSVELCDQKRLSNSLENTSNNYQKEAREFNSYIPKPKGKKNRLAIFADSLGLPRPEEKVGPKQGIEATYPWLISERLTDHIVDSYATRFFTTDSIVEMLKKDREIAKDSDVIIHVGLNDCANRMFLENERISLNLLPPALRQKIVGFSQKYRKQIILNLPPKHYVDPKNFEDNLVKTAELLRERNAKKIIVTTIILVPIRTWVSTPNINANFANYNNIIMQSAIQNNMILHDFDRHVWANMHSEPLAADGMHLSSKGHDIFATNCVKLLEP